MLPSIISISSIISYQITVFHLQLSPNFAIDFYTDNQKISLYPIPMLISLD